MQSKQIRIIRGVTFRRSVRWEAGPIQWRPIHGITRYAPARITANAHGLLDGQRVSIVSVQGMREINARNDPPWGSDFHAVTVIDNDVIELNDVDASCFGQYSGGGYLRSNTPVDMTGYQATLEILDKPGGKPLFSVHSGNSGLVIDCPNRKILMTISDEETGAFMFQSGVLRLIAIAPDGSTTALLSNIPVVVSA